MKFQAKAASDAEMVFIQTCLANGCQFSDAYAVAFPEFKGTAMERSKLANALSKRKVVAAALGRAVQKQQRVLAVAIDQAVERYGLTADRAADALARLAFTELRQVVDWGHETDKKTGKRSSFLRVRDVSEIDADAHQAIAKVRRGPGGDLSVELADKVAAVRALAQLKGWIKEDKAPAQQQVVLFKVEK